jgi:hypothetical protein
MYLSYNGPETELPCEYCGVLFKKPNKFLRTSKHNYCSRNCNSLARRSRVIVVCAQCGKHTHRATSRMKSSKSSIFFCSRACKDKAQRIGGIKAIQPPHYGCGNGMYDYRRRAVEHYGCKCAFCNVTEIGMLDVHHIDENRGNNVIGNLIVLCANHHVLVTRGLANIVDRQLHMLSTN